MDVWMKKGSGRIIPLTVFPSGSPWMGIAQQFLFHYARHHAADLRQPSLVRA